MLIWVKKKTAVDLTFSLYVYVQSVRLPDSIPYASSSALLSNNRLERRCITRALRL